MEAIKLIYIPIILTINSLNSQNRIINSFQNFEIYGKDTIKTEGNYFINKITLDTVLAGLCSKYKNNVLIKQNIYYIDSSLNGVFYEEDYYNRIEKDMAVLFRNINSNSIVFSFSEKSIYIDSSRDAICQLDLPIFELYPTGKVYINIIKEDKLYYYVEYEESGKIKWKSLIKKGYLVE
jgi:hypothetical protein